MIRKLSTLQDYEFGRTLGEGTFGKVKIGFHKVTKEHVAIKILQKEKIVNSDQIQRLTRQISIMKSLNHKNIIKLYEIIETIQQIYLIMQYAQQGDLMSYIMTKRKLEQSEASKFLYQIVRATEYLHSLGIAHRDLKPTNILLGKNNQIKIADFGLSNIYKPGGRLKTSCGSPCYAAPQVIQGKAYQPVFVDIWSIGIVLFIMVCGYLPFHHKNTQTLYKLIFIGNYQITTNISQQVTSLIAGLIRIQPSKRMKFKQIIQHKWIKKYNNDIYFVKPEHSRITGQINREILNLMQKIQLNPQQVKQQVKKNRHNRLTTIYHLLSRKSPKQIDLFCFNNQKHESFELNRQSIQLKDRKYLQRTPRGECIKKSKNISSIEQKHFLQGKYLKITNSNNRIDNIQQIVQNKKSQQKNSLVQNRMKASLVLPQNQNRIQISRNNSPTTSRRSSLDNKNSIVKRYSFIKKDKNSDIESYNGPYNLNSVFSIKYELLKINIQNFFKIQKIHIKQIDKGIFSFDWQSQENVNININKLNNSNLLLIRISSIKQDSIITLFQKLINFLNQ